LLTYDFERLIEDLGEMKETNKQNWMAFFFLAGAMQFHICACVVEPMQWTGWRHKWTKTLLQ